MFIRTKHKVKPEFFGISIWACKMESLEAEPITNQLLSTDGLSNQNAMANMAIRL